MTTFTTALFINIFLVLSPAGEVVDKFTSQVPETEERCLADIPYDQAELQKLVDGHFGPGYTLKGACEEIEQPGQDG
jgi:hypothetical protein